MLDSVADRRKGVFLISKQALLDEILAGITPEEWQALEDGSNMLPVNDFNRGTLLRLRKFAPPLEEVAADRVELLRVQLANYLEEQLPDKPNAHRFIVASCIGLAYILCEPMHPIESTGIRLLACGGTTTYYCPIREDHEGSLCNHCVCRIMDELSSVS